MGLLTTKIKCILDYYIDSSFHVSLCAISYILLIYNQTYLTVKISDYILFDFIFVFSTTYFAYNYIKFYEIIISKNKRINTLIWSFFISALMFCLISINLFLKLSITKQILVLFISFFTIAYTTPFYRKFTFRSNPILKIFSIAISWTLLIVVFPYYEVFDFYYLLYYSVIIFVMVAVQMIPFEIRDARLDANFTKNSVNIYGLNKVKNSGYVLLLSILVFLIIFSQLYNNINLEVSSLIILVIMAILIRKSAKNQFKYFSSLFVESIPVYWLIIDVLL